VGFPSKTLPPKMCLQLQQQNGNWQTGHLMASMKMFGTGDDCEHIKERNCCTFTFTFTWRDSNS
jgi:hypothetical protein